MIPETITMARMMCRVLDLTHFEPAEIGMLARCFCVPLVSVRVGKIKKEGTLMRPTTVRDL
ncbi:unnamed protein product [Arabis nemorensis]|uniref:Uncharacterized protein n=1 Tax=Arabis nemorensis TaxID=586526 RepID=A0A565BRB7_9BRAS|nr:unnamed protein product [Arabis nemorensis]